MPGFLINKESNNRAPNSKAEPIRSYRWRLGQITFGNQNDQVTNENGLIYYCDLELPSIKIQTLQVPGISANYNFAKKVEFPPVQVTFYATNQLQNTLEKWINNVWNFANGITTSYHGAIQFHEMDNTGEDISTFTLYQAFPSDLRSTNLSMMTEEIKRVTVMFTYDVYNYTSSSGSKSSNATIPSTTNQLGQSPTITIV